MYAAAGADMGHGHPARHLGPCMGSPDSTSSLSCMHMRIYDHGHNAYGARWRPVLATVQVEDPVPVEI